MGQKEEEGSGSSFRNFNRWYQRQTQTSQSIHNRGSQVADAGKNDARDWEWCGIW